MAGTPTSPHFGIPTGGPAATTTTTTAATTVGPASPTSSTTASNNASTGPIPRGSGGAPSTLSASSSASSNLAGSSNINHHGAGALTSSSSPIAATWHHRADQQASLQSSQQQQQPHLFSPRALVMNSGSSSNGSVGVGLGAGAGSRPATPSSAGSNGAAAFAQLTAPAAPLITASMGGLALEEVKQWGDAQVHAWLASNRLSQYGPVFARNDIIGEVLLDVDQNALKEMGILAIGDRIRIFTAIKSLKKRCTETAQTNRTALLRAQERAEQAHQARVHADQLRQDAQLLAEIQRPHGEMDVNGGGSAPGSAANSMSDPSSSASSSGWRFGSGHNASDSNSTLSPNGFSSAATNAGGMRKGHQSRPPPLRLSGSATSNVAAGTPPYPSPSSVANSFNHGQGMGLSQARGLTPGSSRQAKNVAGGVGVTRAMGSPALGSGGSGGGGGDGRNSGAISPPPMSHISHRKTNSALGPASFVQRNTSSASGGAHPVAQRPFGSYAGQGSNAQGRPSTASGGPSGVPKSSAASPTNMTFARSAVSGGRPSTAETASVSASSGTNTTNNTSDGSVPLTPITEGNGYSPTTPSAGSTHFVRRGGSIAGASTGPGGGGGAPAPPSLEDLKRRTIKFIGADGTTRIVNVSDCRDAHDVLARVLKKFGKNPASNSYPPTLGQATASDNPGSAGAASGIDAVSGEVEKYVIVATSGEGATRDLKPEELLAICHAPQPYDPLRERGLTLRRISPSSSAGGGSGGSGDSTSRRIARSGRHKLEAFFGERSFNDGNKDSSGSNAAARPSSPSFLGDDPAGGAAYAGHVTTAGKKMNRASTVSIMSGLGVSAALGVLSGNRGDNRHEDAGSNDYYYRAPDRQQQQQQQVQQQQRQYHQQQQQQAAAAAAAAAAHHQQQQQSSSSSPSANASRHSSMHSSKTSSIFPRKARNFMGQRPPSELISSHLADYFPATEKKVLERTARRSIYGRASSSIRSNKRDSTWSFNAGGDQREETPPPLPNKTSLDVGRSDAEQQQLPPRVEPSAPMLPPVVGRTSLDEWSKSLQTAGGAGAVSGGSGGAGYRDRGGRLEIPDVHVSNNHRPSVGSATASSPGSAQEGGYLAGTSPAPSSASSSSAAAGAGGAGANRPRIVRQGSSNAASRASIDSGRSRRSYASQLRAARGIGGGAGGASSSMIDRSDAASMLTVDEITQEVESRRESRRESMSVLGLSPSEMDEEDEDLERDADDDANAAGWVVDEDGVPIPVGPAKKSIGRDDASRKSRKRSARASVASRSSKKAAAGEKKQPGNARDTATTPTNATTFGVDDKDDEDDEEEEEVYDDSIFKADSGEDDSDSDEVSDEDSDFDSSDDEDARDPSVHEGGGVDDAAGSNGAPSAGATIATTATASSSVSKYAASAAKQPIKWIKGALIGAGSFGSVFLGMNAKNGLLMAVKQVELPSGQTQNDQKKKRMLDALEGEIELLKTLQHENIVQYLDSYADGTHLNIFLEYVPGGSVVALLRNYGAFEEPLVRNFVRQILQGLSFLHNRDIVHRDIKGANILVDNKSCIKISDFGISKKVESDLLANARAHRPSLQGSVFWMAPEVVKQTSYTRKADIWSLGCLVVEMMSGTHPWPNLNQMQALFKIGSSAKPSLPDEISQEAVEFLNLTFELDHEARPSADALLAHAFITEVGGGGGIAGGSASLDGGAGGGEGHDDAIEATATDPLVHGSSTSNADVSDPRTPTRATAAAATTPTKKSIAGMAAGVNGDVTATPTAAAAASASEDA